MLAFFVYSKQKTKLFFVWYACLVVERHPCRLWFQRWVLVVYSNQKQKHFLLCHGRWVESRPCPGLRPLWVLAMMMVVYLEQKQRHFFVCHVRRVESC